MSNLSAAVKAVQGAVQKHIPDILTGAGIAGILVTTALAVRATPKALSLIEEKKKALNADKLTPVETVKTVWTCYIPSTVAGLTSAVCVIGANSVHTRRNTALAAAYSLSETVFKEYRRKVVETVGEKKEQAVRDAVAKEQVERNHVDIHNAVSAGRGRTLFFDALSKQPFLSDIETLRKAQNNLNFKMREEWYISLNDVYQEIGLRPYPYGTVGDELGWNIDREGYIEMDFSAQLTEDGTPCVVLTYRNPPVYGYRL